MSFFSRWGNHIFWVYFLHLSRAAYCFCSFRSPVHACDGRMPSLGQNLSTVIGSCERQNISFGAAVYTHPYRVTSARLPEILGIVGESACTVSLWNVKQFGMLIQQTFCHRNVAGNKWCSGNVEKNNSSLLLQFFHYLLNCNKKQNKRKHNCHSKKPISWI